MNYEDVDNYEKNLRAKVLEHFKNEFTVDSKRVIDTLLKLKKEERLDDNMIKKYSLPLLIPNPIKVAQTTL